MQIWCIPSSSHFILWNKIKAHKKCSVSLSLSNTVPPFLNPCLSHWLCTQFPSLLWCLWRMLIKLKGSLICRYFCMPFKSRTNKHRTAAFKHRLLCILKISIYSSLAPGNRPWGSYLQVPPRLLPPFETSLSIVGLFPCEISLILFSVFCFWLSHYKVTEL